jgi:EAL domain-containing protein (putative c-di-GMP-specific phosphodiesterase class I)
VSFQPILDVRGARTAGWEILARIGDSSTVPTDQWFSAAYALGLGHQLEACVLERVLPQWRLRSPGTFMSINITPMALGVPAIEQLISGHAPLHGLVIELTEQLVPAVQDCWREVCTRLRRLGAMIAIDDIGTGYAELAQILSLRPDIIKLDRGVVATVDRDPAQQALVRFLGEFSDHLDAWVLAEGVERSGQLSTLRDLGVPLAQGWFTGRPHPVPQPCPPRLTGGGPELIEPGNPPPHRMGPVRADRPAGTVRTDLPVAGLVRPACLVTMGDRLPAGCESLVLLDHGGRPAFVVEPADADGPASRTPVSLLVPADLATADAARRAMARPRDRRYHPLVCIDPTGRVLGVLAVQDLVLALAAGPRP